VRAWLAGRIRDGKRRVFKRKDECVWTSVQTDAPGLPRPITAERTATAGAAVQKRGRHTVRPQQARRTIERVPLPDATEVERHPGTTEPHGVRGRIKDQRVAVAPGDVERATGLAPHRLRIHQQLPHVVITPDRFSGGRAIDV